MNFRHRRRLGRPARGAAALVALIAIILGLMTGFRDQLVSHFTFFPEPGMQVDPAGLAAPVEQLMLPTEDGVRISAFHLPREGATRTILYFHGNAGNASHRLPTAVALWEQGASVLLMDYRGYGLSEGSPSEAGAYADARAGLRFLEEEKGLTPQQIVLLGRSLGSAVAVDLAQGRDFAGVILVSPFNSGREVAGLMGLGWAGPFIGRPWDSETKIASLQSPLLVFHGDRDEVLPLALGQALFEAAPEPKAFVVVEGAGHNDLVDVDPSAFHDRVAAFITDTD